MTESIIILIILYFVGSFTYFVYTGTTADYHYFNPVENYFSWKKLNVVGVLFFTLLLNLLFAPFAALYWFIKFFCFIFTVGRND